jgi:hypothetical protein
MTQPLIYGKDEIVHASIDPAPGLDVIERVELAVHAGNRVQEYLVSEGRVDEALNIGVNANFVMSGPQRQRLATIMRGVICNG